MAENRRLTPLPLLLDHLGREIPQVRVRQFIDRAQQPFLGIRRVAIADEHHRVVETREQLDPRPQHAMALSPNRADVRDVEVGDRMEHKVELRVSEGAEIAHIALHGREFQAVALRDPAILLELFVRTVEHGDMCARRSEYGRLLATRRGEAQDVEAADIAEPIFREGTRSKVDMPVSIACSGDLFAANGAGPFTLFRGLAVSRRAVVG
jgi:hypothetical protein